MNKYNAQSKAKMPAGPKADSMLSQCLKKKRYSTPELAEKVAKSAALRAARAIRVYLCGLCGFFHLTSKPLRER